MVKKLGFYLVIIFIWTTSTVVRAQSSLSPPYALPTSVTVAVVNQESVQGNAGMNTLLWLLKNKGQAPVASGLYVFTIQVNDGYETATKIGKVAVFH
jgi:hypothetical protein